MLFRSPIAEEQEAQVGKVLEELGAANKPRLRVRSKIDLLDPAERDALRDEPGTVHISALSGAGLSALLERMDEMLEDDPLRRIRLRVPQEEGKALALIQARARVLSRQYRDGVVELEARAPESLLRRLKAFVVE